MLVCLYHSPGIAGIMGHTSGVGTKEEGFCFVGAMHLAI
jgi:hypothetical protein